MPIMGGMEHMHQTAVAVAACWPAFASSSCPQQPNPPNDPHDYAMVPSGGPPPRPAGAEALPLPEDEPPPSDAVGREE